VIDNRQVVGSTLDDEIFYELTLLVPVPVLRRLERRVSVRGYFALPVLPARAQRATTFF